MIIPSVSAFRQSSPVTDLDQSGSLSQLTARNVEKPVDLSSSFSPAAGVQAPSFSDVLTRTVGEVNTTMQTAETEKARVMSGETNNLHQAMLSIQEANVAFSLMTEVRNKLVESYQEIMRMQV